MPSQTPPRQLTVRAIVLAIILAVILAAANAYLGLFAGLTIATAIPAAVMSMGVLRLMGGSSLLENNIVQTGASAGSSIASGVIFTIPALVIMGYWQSFHYGWVFSIAGLGGLLGVLFSVPLRRSMIVEDPLPFPEGKAAAEVLKAGEEAGTGLKTLAASASLGAVMKLMAASGLRIIPDTWMYAGLLGSARVVTYLGTSLSPALLGVGYIVGLNVGCVVLSGSIISWTIAIPVYQQFFLGHDPVLAAQLLGKSAVDVAYTLWGKQVRYLGVGAMLIGGVWTLISLRSSLMSGLRSSFQAAKKNSVSVIDETERDLPMRWMLVALVAMTLPLLGLYQSIVHLWHVSILMTVIMIVTGFLFVSVSAYLAGLIGSSNNPVSGITISTILFASAILVVLLGRDSSIGAVAAIMIGAVVCCAAAVGGDNLQDLKAGYLVGATPWKQQLMLAIGSISCALVMAPVLQLLAKAYGIGPATAEHPNALSAPQATLMASVAKAVFGGELPWGIIALGACVGAVIIVVDQWLQRQSAHLRVPVLAAAIGIYLPLDLMFPIFLGGLIAAAVERAHRHRYSQHTDLDRLHRGGVLFSAGLITGEALMGIAIAVPIVVSGRADVLALADRFHFNQWVGLAFFACVATALYHVAKRSEVMKSPASTPPL